MRTFDHPNFSKDEVCPICKTAEDKPVVLVAIHGTQEGHNAQAKQFHLGCIELWYDEDATKGNADLLYQVIPKDND